MKTILTVLAFLVALLVAFLVYDSCNMYVLGKWEYVITNLITIVGIFILSLLVALTMVAEIRWQKFHDEE
jgi:uncharacterized membrane protein